MCIGAYTGISLSWTYNDVPVVFIKFSTPKINTLFHINSMYFKLIVGWCVKSVWREEGQKRLVFQLIACKPLLSGHFNKLGISLYEFFSSHNEKSFKNVFSIKLGCLYLQSEGKKMHYFFSNSFACLFITLF